MGPKKIDSEAVSQNPPPKWVTLAINAIQEHQIIIIFVRGQTYIKTAAQQT